MTRRAALSLLALVPVVRLIPKRYETLRFEEDGRVVGLYRVTLTKDPPMFHRAIDECYEHRDRVLWNRLESRR